MHTKSNEVSPELSETLIRLRKGWEVNWSTKELGLSIMPSTGFFTIGINSLLVVRLQSRICHIFNVTVRLMDLLGANTIGEFAQQTEDSTSVDLTNGEEEMCLYMTCALRDLLIANCSRKLGKWCLRLTRADSLRSIS